MSINLERDNLLVVDNFQILYHIDIFSNKKIRESIIIHKMGSNVVGTNFNQLNEYLLVSCGNDHFGSSLRYSSNKSRSLLGRG